MSSPGSPLSDPGSDDGDDVPDALRGTHLDTPSTSVRRASDISHDDTLHPAKKRRTIAPEDVDSIDATWDGASVISEDSYGSAPGSPSHDEYTISADQVTACQWDGCTRGELANTDELINHVQTDHVGTKKNKYTCDWGDCLRKGLNHPSGYALKAHMRSHTKEKPFFCALPECDRSFTRSDALAKHMRTVHEPEPPRASLTNANPIDPKTGQPVRGPKLRLHNGPRPSLPHSNSSGGVPALTAALNPANAGLNPSDPDWDPSPPNDNIRYTPAHHPVTGQPGFLINYPPDIQFSSFESEIPADQLMSLLRRQIHWATQERQELQAECERLERIKHREWALKEVTLEACMESELEHAVARGLLREHANGRDSGWNVSSARDDDEVDLEAAMQKDLRRDLLDWDRDPKWVAERRERERQMEGMGLYLEDEPSALRRSTGGGGGGGAAGNGTRREADEAAIAPDVQAAGLLLGLGHA